MSGGGKEGEERGGKRRELNFECKADEGEIREAIMGQK